MTEFNRDFFKHDPVLYKLYEIIKRGHVVADHTKRTLTENKHIKDFCEEARHFMELPGLKPIYIHYDVSSWYHEPEGAVIKIESIGVYDDFMEYTTARLKGLHSTKNADIPNIN
jgi:hypothetical protein